MDQEITKRTMMFAWITQEELEWLMLLNELEERKDDLEIENIGKGLFKLFENMSSEEVKQRDRALYGLQEEGMIQMEAENIAGELNDIEVEIKQRGRKLINEAKCILEEEKGELTEIDLKLREMEKKEKWMEVGIGILKDACVSTASLVLEKVFRG